LTKSATIRRIGALGAAMAMAMTVRGEIVDRIAASVGNRVITASDLDRQLRVAAFQDGVKPDFSPARKQAAVQAMIEQKLIRTELANSRYPLPDPAELAPLIEQFKKEHFQDEDGYRAALAEYGITEEDFRELLLWQRTLLLFIQVRFETGVQLGAGDVEEYFLKTVKPAAEAAHPGQLVSLEDYRDQIERTLTGQRADKEMDIWLREVRRRTNVVVHEEVLR
jgi:parvulin-like peptidyl-prolyl isomerase